MATADKSGAPNVSYAPFVHHAPPPYVYNCPPLSFTMKQTSCSSMVHEDF
jgi:putative heme iron utilization protein